MKCHVGSRKFELVVQREGIEFESSQRVPLHNMPILLTAFMKTGPHDSFSCVAADCRQRP